MNRQDHLARTGTRVDLAFSALPDAPVVMLTKAMARELGRKGVRVNCICPGVIKTQLSEALWKDAERERAFAAQKALGRIGEVEELVGAAMYFASDASSFTTGAVLTVDGGMVI